MSSPSVAEILDAHVSLELEGIDRMYLNVYVPRLQYESGVAAFLRKHRGHKFASSVLLEPISSAFVSKMEKFADERQIQVITFPKGLRKDDLAKAALEQFTKSGRREGVLFAGKAQEKTPVIRTEKRRNERGLPYPWLVRGTAMVNHWYWYAVDLDFGPFFLKVSTYFPYTIKVCLNGHEYLKRQLAQERVKFEALDNGVLSCSRPKRAQEICEALSAKKIDMFVRKWLRILPYPFTPADTRAGYRYVISVAQAEFSLTQVLDRPQTGRAFFEEIIRENLDIGRPSQVQLIFGRRVMRRTPGRFRTRVLTEGVTPSLHIDYKRSRIKQYHKEGRALRTETTINNAHDFGVGKTLNAANLTALRKIGFEANRNLLKVERLSHDCAIGEDVFARVHSPVLVGEQRASALRFSDTRVQALLSAIVSFRLLPQGFRHADIRRDLEKLLGIPEKEITSGMITYDLRRLRLHGFIERIPESHRYRVTETGLRIALFATRSYARILRPGLSLITADTPPDHSSPLRRAFDQLEQRMNDYCEQARFAA